MATQIAAELSSAYDIARGYGIGDPLLDNPEAAELLRQEAEYMLRAEAGAAAAQQEHQFGISNQPLPFEGSLSNAELIEWLAQHNAKLQTELRNLMTTADERLKLAEDLTKLKGLVGPHLDKQAARDAAYAMQNAYQNTPYAALVKEHTELLIEDYDNRIKNWADDAVPDDIVNRHTSGLQEAIDQLHKKDQLDMIKIQDLTSQIRENMQLVSNMVSSVNQTTMAIINNVGRG